MLLNFLAKDINTTLTALAQMPSGTVIGQMGIMSNLDTSSAAIISGARLSISNAVCTLSPAQELLLFWDGAVWRKPGIPVRLLDAPSAAPADAVLAPNNVTFWLDESGNKLTFKVKYAAGTVKTGTVSLT